MIKHFHFNKLSSGKKIMFHLLQRGYTNKKISIATHKGGAGHVPEYFVGIGTPISFYG